MTTRIARLTIPAAVLAALLTLAALTGSLSTYGIGSEALNSGVTLAGFGHCVGFEARGVVGVFDCSDGGL